MPLIPILILFAALVTVGFFILKTSKRAKLRLIPKTPELAAPQKNFEFIQKNEIEENLAHPELLGRVSKSFDDFKIKSIYLLHGTFVGDDPFHVAAILERSFPNLRPSLIAKIKQKVKQGQNLLAKDVGNFVEDHVSFLQELTSSNIVNFSWSSANHHYGRLEGALNLIHDLKEKHEGDQRVLLIGHSHAGQIFAILTQLFFNQEFREYVQGLIPDRDLYSELAAIQNLKFDFVTLGTPARYPWFLAENMRLLHLINHRGHDLLGGSFKDATFTRKGDYIQQWGIAGSDAKSADAEIQKINKDLERFLGAGNNLDILRAKIQFKNRLHVQGYHLLIDFGDEGKFPNFFKTVFGHGVYTRIKFMPFVLNKIREKFYSETLTLEKNSHIN